MEHHANADLVARASSGMNLTDSVYERLLRDRIIVLGSEVDDDVANRSRAR